MRIRSHLVLLFLGILIPILAFSGVMLVVFNRHTRVATEQGLVETARALSVAVDQQVLASLSVLRVLAASEHLQKGNVQEFERVARMSLATQPAWQSIVLVGPDMRQVINTGLPTGTPLPLAGNPELARVVFATASPMVSDLFVGRVIPSSSLISVVFPAPFRPRKPKIEPRATCSVSPLSACTPS